MYSNVLANSKQNSQYAFYWFTALSHHRLLASQNKLQHRQKEYCHTERPEEKKCKHTHKKNKMKRGSERKSVSK